MKTQWQLARGTRIDSVDLADGLVFVGTDEGFGHGSSAAAATYAEFLEGKLNDLVQKTFGSAVLSEVRASVTAAA